MNNKKSTQSPMLSEPVEILLNKSDRWQIATKTYIWHCSLINKHETVLKAKKKKSISHDD